MRVCLDAPFADEVLNPKSLLLEGWGVGPSSSLQLSKVEVWAEGTLVGATRHWFARNDVTAALVLPDGVKPGFAIGLFLPDTPRTRQSIELRFFEGAQQVGTLERILTFSDASPLLPCSADFVPRHPSYPSLHRLIARTVTTPQSRLGELGCGRGEVGRFLCNAGLHWHGIEGRPAECEVLAATGLPFVRPTGHGTPYRTGGFDFALGTDLAPDVLEHWLPEMRRLATQGVLLNGCLGNDGRRRESELLLSRHLVRCESLPYRTASTGEGPATAYDRWFLFALGWA